MKEKPNTKSVSVDRKLLEKLLADFQSLSRKGAEIDDLAYQHSATLESVLDAGEVSALPPRVTGVQVRRMSEKRELALFFLEGQEDPIPVQVAPLEGLLLRILSQAESGPEDVGRWATGFLTVEQIMMRVAEDTDEILSRHHTQEVLSRLRQRLESSRLGEIWEATRQRGYRLRLQHR